MVIKKVLIANRGEIALRVIRACKELGIRTVAVYSQADRWANYVSQADESHLLGPAPSRESYLRIDRLIEIARKAGADAIHPGYGFLAESAALADACERAGIVFVGPTVAQLETFGDKTAAKRLAQQARVPTVPGTDAALHDTGAVLAAAVGCGGARTAEAPRADATARALEIACDVR